MHSPSCRGPLEYQDTASIKGSNIGLDEFGFDVGPAQYRQAIPDLGVERRYVPSSEPHCAPSARRMI